VNGRHTGVRSDAANLPALTGFLQEFWSAAELPPALAPPFELALEEVFINVVTHGSSEGTVPWVEVSIDLADGGVTMTVEDDGPPFDPLTLPAPNVAAALSERRVGGLGVYLVRQMMDAVTYARVGTRNQLRMTKRLTP
jgi:serine/threonine-protein kinase RsbW